MNDDLKKFWKEASQEIDAERKDYDRKNELWWTTRLSEEERENAFYAVVKRLHRAEVVEQRSFRGTLYGVFGFGTQMYSRAMDCGFMSLHNAVFDGTEFMNMSTASNLEVIGPDGTSVTWPDVENLTITAEDGKVTVSINKGNPYV